MERILSSLDDSVAFGAPGVDPSWQHGDKDGVGTAYSSASRLWFTIWNGIVTEVYAPTVDKPQIRDLQFLFYDEKSFVEEEIKMKTSIEAIEGSLGYRILGKSSSGPRFSFEKEVICDPHRSTLLVHLKVIAEPEILRELRACVLCAPHLHATGKGNTAQVIRFLGSEVLVAEHDGEWLALASDAEFTKTSVGYVGTSDAWTDLHAHGAMTWQFKSAPRGNVAVAGEVDLAKQSEFTILLSFGQSQHSTLTSSLQSRALPYKDLRDRFVGQWRRIEDKFQDLGGASSDGGALYKTSTRLLLAHEDKIFPGAMVASLANPWGEARGDDDGKGGYHLIWTRDLVQSALGLLAAGDTETPLRAFLYIAASQDDNGRFPQNFWVNGVAYWDGLQLDEVAFPLILGHRLWKAGVIKASMLHETFLRAISFLILSGPVTMQERWEETAGLSPSTLAVLITAMICVSEVAESDGAVRENCIIEDYADWLEANIERWTVTRTGCLLKDYTEHFVRINPVQPGQEPPDTVDVNRVTLSNQSPGAQNEFAAREIVDAGFLELVRYGVRSADDPLVVSSLAVVDAYLRVETPSGTAWRRYNHDGYGQQADGSSYVTFGQGRAWPLLTGERGHLEIAAGRSARDYISWMEGLATPTHLLPEQSWDMPVTENGRQRPGRPTGSAVPLLWAHAEYIKLLRSQIDGRVFDLQDRVLRRYAKKEQQKSNMSFWSFLYPLSHVPKGATLRIVAEAAFELHFTTDDWATQQLQTSERTRLRFNFADIRCPVQTSSVAFTFHWTDSDLWEGTNYDVSFSDI